MTSVPEAAPTGADLNDIGAGGCSAWSLPSDEKCPGTARSFACEALTAAGLPKGYIADATLCVSELSTNAIMHAPIEGPPAQPVGRPPTPPELWLYRRSHETGAQFVFVVFDALRWWREQDSAGDDELLAEDGRGLGIVQALAGGHNGWHLTRSRLGNWSRPGKACWFALPIPPASAYACPPQLHLTAAKGTSTLARLLVDRGLQPDIHRDAERRSVLSVRHGLAVWCRADAFQWANKGTIHQRPISDLIEVAERIVQLHEEMTVSESGD